MPVRDFVFSSFALMGELVGGMDGRTDRKNRQQYGGRRDGIRGIDREAIAA